MAIENATYISQLDAANPKGTDQRGTVDDHARLIKRVLLNSFPNVNSEVSASSGELNALVGVTSGVQEQIVNEILVRSATSQTLNTQIQTLSATMNTDIQNTSAALSTQMADLSATLHTTLLTISGTAADSNRWSGSALFIDATTASVSANMSAGDLGFVL